MALFCYELWLYTDQYLKMSRKNRYVHIDLRCVLKEISMEVVNCFKGWKRCSVHTKNMRTLWASSRRNGDKPKVALSNIPVLLYCNDYTNEIWNGIYRVKLHELLWFWMQNVKIEDGQMFRDNSIFRSYSGPSLNEPGKWNSNVLQIHHS